MGSLGRRLCSLLSRWVSDAAGGPPEVGSQAGFARRSVFATTLPSFAGSGSAGLALTGTTAAGSTRAVSELPRCCPPSASGVFDGADAVLSVAVFIAGAAAGSASALGAWGEAEGEGMAGALSAE